MNDTRAALGTVEITELLKILPHRYPFLLIDRIVDIDGDLSATGIKNVTFNEPHFQGHFPDHPIMPGVLIVEAMAQTAGAICLRAMKEGRPSLVYFMTIENARFRRPVVPGDRLEIAVKKLKQRGNVARFGCTAMVGDEKAAEADITFMNMPAQG